ncbi:F-box domain-containing protein [Marssonina coronariae]|uniref:F-box domain-containing protein n=1 Tax=Diplocarpon coronariae TaxID=2795749 RepID=A0A218Z4K3_9HELO|nr:F-box domain-containing protein [Marssonina coronariae]
MARLDTLPSEIILQIARLLEASDIVTLQRANRRLLVLSRDDNLWRENCFKKSSFLSNLRRRRELVSSNEQDPGFRDLARALAAGNGLGDSRLVQFQEEARHPKARSNERIRILANWDPSYPKEKIDWYSEYIARNAPISTSWMEQPRNRDHQDHEYLEIRGMAIYTPVGDEEATLVVGCLDDGSVCLWDLTGRKGRKGSVIARSESGLIAPRLSQAGAGKHSRIFIDGLTEGEFKKRPGNTLIACGEYNSKGSLEMYGLSPTPYSTISSDCAAGSIHSSVMKNRQTSSSSKVLSVSNHGTRIVISDGDGNLKWLERDGFTEARRWNIAHGSIDAPRGIFGTLGDGYMDSGSGDIAIKIANTNNRADKNVNEDDLILWTGEKIGLLSFTTRPGFTGGSFEETAEKTPEEAQRESEEKTYAETMGRALEANANEVRWMRGLGLNSS